MSHSIMGERQGAAPFPISILDFTMAGRGLNAYQALSASVELARLVDRRGFTRYWVAEHHSAWQEKVQADELMILNLGHSPDAIYRSTELIADVYGMPKNVFNESTEE